MSYADARAVEPPAGPQQVVLVSEQLRPPVLVVHAGAGAYLRTTTVAQRRQRGRTLEAVVREGLAAARRGGARAAVLTAVAALERDPEFNCGYGSRLQQDGKARLSAALSDGRRTRLAAIYNVQDCLYPSRLADALLERPDRNLDGYGAQLLMAELGVKHHDVRTAKSIARWEKLLLTGDHADREAAIGEAGEHELELARAAQLPIPKELERPYDGSLGPVAAAVAELPPEENRYGTVGAVAVDCHGELFACTSTGGRGHEHAGRISDSPTPAGSYACPAVALSATGFGEQIIDLNLCGRIATRMLDGASLEPALRRTFTEVTAAGGLLGVIAVTADGMAGYAHTTEACGVAWLDGTGRLHVDQHGR